ncbi:dATP/dGTP pyrophosphohydrolase domain-containing protein [Citrobacter farmeri]
MGDAVIPLYAAPPAPVSVPDENGLLPCPCCGGKADFDYDDDNLNWISCSVCGIATDTAYHTDVDARDKLREVWNSRAALLQGSQPVSNRDELREQVRREHAEWSDATFGDVGPVGPLKHLSKEALEAAADPSDSLEWADMQFLLWDAQRRMGLSDDFITRAMIEKLAINKTRQWPEPKDGEPRLHIKEQSESVFPEVECDICGHVSTDPEGRHYCCEDNSND